MIRPVLTSALACVFLSACASTSPVGPRGEDAYRIFPPLTQAAPLNEYEIGPFDVISITTYQEEDLSFDDLKVDASGNILFPLIGSVMAAGLTAQELSQEIETRLGERFLVNPRVTIVVDSSASREVTVEGAVRNAGIYPIEGGTTLLQAIALADGPTEVGSTDDVVIFRTINGQRMAGVFNLTAIRRGLAEDPQVLGNDVVVVAHSSGRQLYRDILSASPLIAGIFRPLADSGGNNN